MIIKVSKIYLFKNVNLMNLRIDDEVLINFKYNEEKKIKTSINEIIKQIEEKF